MNRDAQASFIKNCLNFSYLPLDKVSLHDRHEVLLKACNICGGVSAAGVFLGVKANPVVNEEQWATIKKFQDAWRDSIEWLVSRISQISLIEYDVKFVFVGGEKPEEPFVSGPSLESYERPLTCRIYYKHDEIVEKKNFPSGTLRFFEALNGFPKRSLSKCKFCQKVFFNPTMRQKEYCSSRCRNAAAQRRYREKKREN